MMDATDLVTFERVQKNVAQTLAAYPLTKTLPPASDLDKSSAKLFSTLPQTGIGLTKTSDHLLQDVVPGLNGASLSPTYYGFVTGGITPAARVAETVVSLYDQNVQVHLPQETVATIVEDRALSMLLELFDREPRDWPSRTFTTGATSGNVLGLACGRDFVLSEKLRRAGKDIKVGEGVLSSCARAGIEKFQVLTTLPHSSLGKAANIVGVGSDAMIDVSRDDSFLAFDMQKLEQRLRDPKAASIVVISCGEVNTGGFATHSFEEVHEIRKLCRKYGAWLHVDGAFGLFANLLPQTSEHSTVRAGVAGMTLADSIGGDAHKLLNVPYDCGFFFCKSREIVTQVFRNTNAAYLSAAASSDGIQSPLNARIENSSRFRGLPVYSTLLAYGREGYADMITNMVTLSRRIALYIRHECAHLELLPLDVDVGEVFMCVLFRARDDALNAVLTERIKSSRKVYGSGTSWDGKPAVRLAIGKWDVDVERDLKIVMDVLGSLA